MAIISTDIQFFLSVLTGAAGNSTAGTPGGSLGKYISTTQLSGTALNNLWDDVSGDENAASEAEYRCIFVLNNHATLTLLSPVVWIFAETAGGASVALSVDTTVASAKGSASAQAKQVVDENTAPASQTFVTTPISKATGLALGDLPAGQVRGIWIRRTAANSAALDNDGYTLRVEGDTAA
jgi:hypothetical protein